MAQAYHQNTVGRLRQEDLWSEASPPAWGLPTPCQTREEGTFLPQTFFFSGTGSLTCTCLTGPTCRCVQEGGTLAGKREGTGGELEQCGPYSENVLRPIVKWNICKYNIKQNLYIKEIIAASLVQDILTQHPKY